MFIIRGFFCKKETVKSLEPEIHRLIVYIRSICFPLFVIFKFLYVPVVCNFGDFCNKEMTVKGLEPEIQRLIAQHKMEIKKIKSIQEAELLEADERAGQRYVKMTEELRDQLAREKESACARERDLAKQT